MSLWLEARGDVKANKTKTKLNRF
ncbi:hypothetical protein OOU_Y34scaffold00301g2 [Pyricularia oryzae Y34]|uniref:Uncharacterized protein n=3 Tax=Pyricularia oryzae TaxID=318829 RepID=Q2KG08_PYRO7|nr:hypothetical protein MGCH7_ch7g527 [Pyricularia oryzae 70-15]ELQ41082.1 hypothetical protein OOU_Y34scaffold00301g2 [Pyricularia oryzae Y34]